MKKNGMRKRILLFVLTTAIVLTMQGTSVFAEMLQPADLTETSEMVQSVSQNGIPEKESISQNGIPDEESVSQNTLSKPPLENQLTTSVKQSVSENGLTVHNNSALTSDILAKCTVPGLNPEGAVVNLFDYWQESGSAPANEIAHDYWINDLKDKAVTTFDSGISKGHLLRFAYRDTGSCEYCNNPDLSNFGAWNEYRANGAYPGLVKNRLGVDGFPQLNLNTIANTGVFGRYNDAGNEVYLTKKEESLAYLFSPSITSNYKAIHQNVQGLFQLNSDGYYYYRSTENFASYDAAANSFILYNSPGVARASNHNPAKAEFCGQFFPFNKATDVFDSYTDVNGNYRLTYQDINNQGKVNNDYTPVNGYIQCYAPNLNHYLGMTLEVPFMQPDNGHLPNGAPMTFSFSGDDDVWIFIDGVLVADLGGLHDAYSLKIDFATGNIDVQGQGAHTLLSSFQDAYPGLVMEGFNGSTFAGNTTHILKMFYMERGHMASDLSLEFNIHTVYHDPVSEAEQSGNAIESGESAPDSEPENTIMPVVDNKMMDSVEIPQTGDDSLIWWWAVLCIVSVLGIGAVVCNLILTKRKQKKHSSKK